jgi:release factor glutamine methyltransferase
MIASDISEEALQLARENAIKNNVSDRIEFIKADLLDISRKYKGAFDIIVSNPPYISRDRLEYLSPELRQEPGLALDGGEKGLDFYQRIIERAPYFLKGPGAIALELGDDLAKDVKGLLEDSRSFEDIRIFRDLNNIGRVITALTWIS